MTDPVQEWGFCRLCDSSFEFEDGLPTACSNPECASNTEPDEFDRAAAFAVALGMLELEREQKEGK